MATIQIPLVLAVFFFHLFSGARSSMFTVVNKCSYTVWPGVLSSAGIPPLSPTGFILQPGQSTSIDVPTSWSGRLWGRTLCTKNSSGKFSCLTGDCGSSTLECSGAGAIPPATLAEFTLNGAGGLDFYDVSLVDGYNLPMMVVPHGGKGGNCSSAECAVDLNGDCPLELKVVDGSEGVACNSACNAFNQPQYCCSGAYSTPNTCKPSSYSKYFKTACPTAYSYAYDDGTSTFTCAGADYVITFCPAPSTSIKSSNPMAVDISAGSGPASSSALIAGTLTTLAAIWQLWHLF
ncbi:Thaumatin-like protein 1 [Hibiscus syriacus]|uniref:Thaumatin-like protein 1 n=1 Tax=Hibiscus syriacus TaxID=106335 RepID=A0A6A3BI83_HIBSY|nr:pathogenesis-related thaumatin-like protein 3.5 [Hibiscus syriacus]KAE8715935.1 Thaumatin-like protein 1 [Hibiscus syriacus]